MTLGIVDYGAGNLKSVQYALERLGENSFIASTPELVRSADRLVLPGVGAAGTAMASMRQRGLDQALDETVRRNGRPLLGICLGMQLLAEEINEFGTHKGLGWLTGTVSRMPGISGTGKKSLYSPHMGWDAVHMADSSNPLFAGLQSSPEFYFAHSNVLFPEDEKIVISHVDYGSKFVASIQFDSVVAVQFHPERSQLNGERMLENFLCWSP
jgi:imidazole glycerol-phosphate synthase subunit HisH